MVDDSTGSCVATVCGVVERINKLVFVRPIRSRFVGEVGDVVVGRISEVGGDRWLVDIGGTQFASLPLGGINLPGSVQRRRTDEDKMQMRDYFREGDVFVCEVQKIMENGEVIVHCRSNKYGILRNGQLVQVDASLVRRQASHFLTLPGTSGELVQVVLGNNGWIWVGLPSKQTGHIQSLNFTQMDSTDQTVSPSVRMQISKIRNVILGLAAESIDVRSESLSQLLSLVEKAGDIFPSADMISVVRESLENMHVDEPMA